VPSTKKYHNLGLSVKNGLHFMSKEASWEKLSFKTKQALLVIQPFAFYCFNNEPLILFFHNCFDAEKKRKEQLCWNFNKASVIIFFDGKENPISDDGNEIRINTKSKIEIKNAFDLDASTGELNDLPDAKIKEFSYWNIVSGRIWETYAESFKNENRVDYKLLENIGAVRDIFIKSKPEKDRKEAAIIINRVLGRLIFVRYLVDRNVRINFKKEYLTKEDLTDIICDSKYLYSLFEYLQSKFNGDLFPFVQESEGDLPDSYLYEQSKLENSDLELISYLFEGAKFLGKNVQPSLFHLYDFSVIPIELVSNIYEYFMGDKKQDENKAFYTPPFLVDYLINETIEPYLEKRDTRYCTTLDPACGSGIFLVETLRRIILRYKKSNPDISPKSFKGDIISILSNNIFGIDKDRDAIDVSIFSLYVTLLDFMKPKDIEDFQFPPLLRSNFFEADFFETDFSEKKQNDFIERFNRIKLDFIIGNPPWGKVKDSPYMQYAKERLKKEPEELQRLLEHFPNKKKSQIQLVNNNEIAQGFLLRTFDFAVKDETTCALLVTSKVLHNLQSDVFRNYFLNQTKVEKVVDFSAIRKDLFSFKPKGAKKTIGPCAFLIYKWTDNSVSQNIVQHYSPKNNRIFQVFKILTIQKFDYKKIRQQQFIDFDWCWKVFLYGNLLDFKFVKFLKENFKTIAQLTDNEKEFVKNRGVEPNGDKHKNLDYLQGLTLIDTNKDLNRFILTLNKNTEWKIGRGKNRKIWDRKTAYLGKKEMFEKGLFNGNSLLISKGLNPFFYAVCAFTDKKAVFRDSISGIKAKTTSGIALIKSFVGLLNSKLFSYYIFSVGSSTGVEREQVQDAEKFSLPVSPNLKIADFIDEISDVKGQLHQLEQINEGEMFTPKLKQQKKELEQKAQSLENRIERVINKTYNFTKEEKALIDFSQTVSIPLFKGNSTPFEKVGKSQMNKYVKVFENHFTQVFNKQGKYFQVDVFESDFMIGVKFNVVKNKPEKTINYKKDDKEQTAIMEMLSVIAFEQITDRIFIQKDVKVINKDSFWIIKPNEFKCWHEAVAYLDLDEFIPKLIRPQKTILAHA